MSDELRRDFHDRLAVLHDRVGEMGLRVADGVRHATKALLSSDAGLAAEVVEADREIDAAYPWVEAEVFDVVARQSPVARDLRFVIATFRVAANIERCGDLVASIARRAEPLDAALPGSAAEIIETMGAAVEETFRRAMQAYRVLDPELAATVAGLDVEVDELERKLLREVVKNPTDVEAVIDLVLVARFYERIADHAVVIGERVRFVALGEMDPGDRDGA